jgi:hypothetical protein
LVSEISESSALSAQELLEVNPMIKEDYKLTAIFRTGIKGYNYLTGGIRLQLLKH